MYFFQRDQRALGLKHPRNPGLGNRAIPGCEAGLPHAQVLDPDRDTLRTKAKG